MKMHVWTLRKQGNMKNCKGRLTKSSMERGRSEPSQRAPNSGFSRLTTTSHGEALATKLATTSRKRAKGEASQRAPIFRSPLRGKRGHGELARHAKIKVSFRWGKSKSKKSRETGRHHNEPSLRHGEIRRFQATCLRARNSRVKKALLAMASITSLGEKPLTRKSIKAILSFPARYY